MNTIRRVCIFLFFIVVICLVAILFMNGNTKAGLAVDTSDKEIIEYSITKNDRIKVLDAATVSAPRKITTTYWILCIDGYKFISLTQGSGADIIQLFESDHTPVPCN